LSGADVRQVFQVRRGFNFEHDEAQIYAEVNMLHTNAKLVLASGNYTEKLMSLLKTRESAIKLDKVIGSSGFLVGK
jgi:hypothetical protein